MEYIKLTNHFELVLMKVMVQGLDTSVKSFMFSKIIQFNSIQFSTVLTISIKCLTHALWAQYTKT